MEPIFFNPTYKNVIWGGNNISKIFKRNVIGDDIGESWELSAHPNGLSIIKNAEYKQKSLYDLFNDKEQKVQIFGTHCENMQKYPILTTYRVYDWNRKDKNGNPRELHRAKALDVIDLQAENKVANYENVNQNTNIYKSDVFNIDMIKVNGKEEASSKQETFYAYIVIEGEGNINAGGFFRGIEKGDTFLIPAKLGKYTLSGNMKLMKVWI